MTGDVSGRPKPPVLGRVRNVEEIRAVPENVYRDWSVNGSDHPDPEADSDQPIAPSRPT